ncbi:DNA-protecting protein DprA [bacterium]|jgi:DNA processing protein|nr:DNA-protecting protein DprA [bacterium]
MVEKLEDLDDGLKSDARFLKHESIAFETDSERKWVFFLNYAFKDDTIKQWNFYTKYNNVSEFLSDSEQVKGLFSFEKFSQIQRLATTFSLEKIEEKLKKNGIKTCFFGDEHYPFYLSEIYDPPLILYYKGDINCLKSPCLGVVGSRKYSNYGQSVTSRFVKKLSHHFCIVSGLAIGIDTLAHEATLEESRFTAAVVANGLDTVYPRMNIGLSTQIEKTGCIVSEMPMGTTVMPFRFPRRNRIISGLSKGVLVVEAQRKSGSLITCRTALEQDRDVFAVPGSVFSFTSTGCNDLIKDGARMVTCPEDVLSEYDEFSTVDTKTKKASSSDVQQGTLFSSNGYSNEELAVWSILESDPMSIEKVIERSKLSSTFVSRTLSKLELDNMVESFPGHLYKKSNHDF